MRNRVHAASAPGTCQPLVPARVMLRSCDGRCDARPAAPAPNTAGNLLPAAANAYLVAARTACGTRIPGPNHRRSPASNIPDPTADWRGTLLLRLPQVTLRPDARLRA